MSLSEDEKRKLFETHDIVLELKTKMEGIEKGGCSYGRNVTESFRTEFFKIERREENKRSDLKKEIDLSFAEHVKNVELKLKEQGNFYKGLVAVGAIIGAVIAFFVTKLGIKIH